MKNQIKRSVLAIFAVVYALIAATASGQSKMENTIRMTYAKATFAAQVGAIEKTFLYEKLSFPKANLDQVVQDNTITFQLSNFKDGDVSCSREPMSALASSFAGKPIISLEIQKNTWHSGGVQDSVEVAALIRDEAAPEHEDSGMKDLVICDLNTLSIYTDPQWSQFTTYDVTATHKGKSVSYHASFLFDIHGNAAAFDPFVQGLSNFITVSVYPEVMLKHLNTNAAVMKWAEVNSTRQGMPQQMLCDLIMLKCMIPASDIVNKSGPPTERNSNHPAR